MGEAVIGVLLAAGLVALAFGVAAGVLWHRMKDWDDIAKD